MSETVITPEFRVSYPNVFKAKMNTLSEKEEFSLVALFDADADLSELKKAAKDAIIKKWGADKDEWPENLKSPFRKQEERGKKVDGKKVLPNGYEEGGIFINLKSKQRPGVVAADGQTHIYEETDFYAGCYARASIRAYAYDAKGNRGVAFGLNNLQKVRDGDPLGGRMKAEDEFAPVKGSSQEKDDDFSVEEAFA